MKLAVNKNSSLKAHWQFWLWISLSCFIASNSSGQGADTVLLQEVVITSSAISEFSIGARVTTLDSTILSADPGMSLAAALRQTSPVYIKSYGNGMLSSISFRGTGASHTSILWNGLNIGYPMLGQSDLTVLPIFLNPEITLQHGSASALYGSGAIGGTINLAASSPKPGLTLSLMQEAGSFSTFFTGGNISYAKNNSYFNLKGFIKSSKNDFPYKNTAKINSPIEKQQNASYGGAGIDLEGQVRVSPASKIQLALQFIKFNREVQPSINDRNNTDQQDDTNLRTRAAYFYNFRKSELQIDYAYLNDQIIFNQAKTQAAQNVFGLKLSGAFASKFTYNLGGHFKQIVVKSPFFAGDEAEEKRSSLYGSLKYSPHKWQITANLRQTFVSGYEVPFTPSVGLEYLLVNRTKHQATIKYQLGSGYRVPTLNDRFWQPGGNVNLRPESSLSVEVGLAGKTKKTEILAYEITIYHMKVDNWILWLPEGSYWSPQNIKTVAGSGLEVNITINQKISAYTLRWLVNYAYTRSINQTGIDAFDRSVGKQLPYVPLNNGNLSVTISHNQWTLGLVMDVTGKRFVTADNESVLPAFALLDFQASKTFKTKALDVVAFVNLNNILNSSYQNIKNKAMPGFNFNAGIKINFIKL